MRRLAVSAAWLVTSVVAGGCALSSPPPLARVRLGPAFDRPPVKVLALPARCESHDDFGCDGPSAGALEVAARMSLEFAGHRVVDSELVNVELRERLERVVDDGSGRAETRQVQVRDSRWTSASPGRQSAVLSELGIDGVLSSRISFGVPAPYDYTRRRIEVEVSLTRAADGAVVWISRCAVASGQHHQSAQAVELASRCALDSATSVAP